MITVLLALALVFGPPALYVWAAVSPATMVVALPVALAGAALPFLIAAFRREGRLGQAALGARWLCPVAMFASMVFIQNMMWAVRLGHCGLTELSAARAQVERFRAAHGRAPANLEELGPLPRLRIWTVTRSEAEHLHPATARASIVRGDVPPPDDGGWGYDPEKGRVFLSCTGVEPKLRRTPLHEL